MTSVHRRLLGDTIARLPSVLQRFHQEEVGAKAEGVLRVTRGRGIVHRMVGWLAGFPAPAEASALRLEVRVEGDRERWIRYFGDTRLESIQWCDGDLFAEAAGPMVFLFRVSADDGVLRYRFVRARMLGIPLPSWSSPRGEVDITEGPTPDSWHVDVRFSAPVLGQLLRYEGIVRRVE